MGGLMVVFLRLLLLVWFLLACVGVLIALYASIAHCGMPMCLSPGGVCVCAPPSCPLLHPVCVLFLFSPMPNL